METFIKPTESIAKNYADVRKQSMHLIEPLELEDFVCQPIAEVSPPKWHLGHSSWFFENFILSKFLPGYKCFDPNFNYLFNSYYNSQGDRILRNSRGFLNRPTTKKIIEYRSYVDKYMFELLEQENLINDELLLFLKIGLNHEQQHQELLLTDIKYIFGSNPLLPAYQESKQANIKSALPFKWLPVKEGLYKIGYSGEGFHFDNEAGEHQVFLQNFLIGNRTVTNEEYIEFMDSGGYQQAEHWLSDGWDWVCENEIESPLYWFKRDKEWHIFRLDGVQRIVGQEPLVHLSFYEADAFARWKGCRLPTEQEWEVSAKQYGRRNDSSHFQEKGHFHPEVALENQFLGSLWEWTRSSYLPYPGYKQAKGALGEYNGKFMVNQQVLRGGSLASPHDHIRLTYRNFFHPNLRWQFCGIRLAKDHES